MAVSFLRGFVKPPSKTAQAIQHVLSGTALPFGIGSLYSDWDGGWDFDKSVNEGLERVIWVARCVDAIASNESKLPIKIRKGDPKNGKFVEDEDMKNILRLLNGRPNSYEDAQMFRYRRSAQQLLSKRGTFIELVRNQLGRVAELHLIPPDVIEPIPDEYKFISGFRITGTYRNYGDEIPMENVLWHRGKPHPQDPYSQMTPMMSAGLAIDTDFFARLYNRNFLANGGKSGLLIAVKGQLQQTDADELKYRFRGGPYNAGTPTVIEAEHLQVEDLGATPHDIQWLQAIQGSKEDILIAFGVPESLIGNASGRTFDNADQEEENFWEVTEEAHCTSWARSLDPLTGSVEDDRYIAYDFSEVEALQRAKRKKEERAKADYESGLLTIDEYFELLGKEKWNVPGTRVLYLKNGQVVGRNQEDTDIVTKQPPVMPVTQQQGALGMANGLPPALQPFDYSSFGGKAFLARSARLLGHQVKELEASDDIIDGEVVPGPPPHPYAQDYALVEKELAAVLEGWSEQQERIIPGRVAHAKCLKNTRHWVSDDREWSQQSVGIKALNPRYIVDVNRWTTYLTESLNKVLGTVAEREMRRAALDMDRSAFTKLMAHLNRGGKGKTPVGKVFGNVASMKSEVDTVLASLAGTITQAANRQQERVMKRITEMDQSGATVKQIQDEIRSMVGRRSDWKEAMATWMTTAVVEAAKFQAYSKAGDLLVKSWNMTGDERVRDSHIKASATQRNKQLSTRFRVGKSLMMHPGDPAGAAEETARCRCWTDYTIAPKYARLFDDIAHS